MTIDHGRDFWKACMLGGSIRRYVGSGIEQSGGVRTLLFFTFSVLITRIDAEVHSEGNRSALLMGCRGLQSQRCLRFSAWQVVNSKLQYSSSQPQV
jgi:hypothetical protein